MQGSLFREWRVAIVIGRLSPAQFGNDLRARMTVDPEVHHPGDPQPIASHAEGGVSAPHVLSPLAPKRSGDAALAIELKWLREVYQGDHVKQATFRALLMGAILGGALSLQNLYVGLKTGWGLGVAVTACILSYTIYATLVRLLPRVFGPAMSILENNAMQTTASSAGYSTGGVMTSAIAAYLIVNKHHIGFVPLSLWTFFLAVLGTVMAIPMKRQMVNIEQLKFPTGMAAAETLKSLYARDEGSSAKARALAYSGAVGAIVAWLRDAHAPAKFQLALDAQREGGAFGGDTPQWIAWLMVKLTMFSKIPPMIAFPKLTIAGVPAIKYTVAFEGSLIMIAVGALMGMRTTLSMVVAAIVNWAFLAPYIQSTGGITELGFRGIVSWSLWPGAALMVTSGLLTFAMQWRTVVRAFRGLGSTFKKATARERGTVEESANDDARVEAERQLEAVEVPGSWFAGGIVFATLGLVTVGKIYFNISLFFGVLAVALTFVLAIVACRSTGETDITPMSAMGKITQLTYGVLAPGNITTNLMTASITAGGAISSADLLTDLKSGYLLGANPRKQFFAQLVGTVVGTAVTVPMFYVLVPNADMLGTDKFPAPSAQVWAGVAKLLSQGIEQLHYTARWGIVVGGALGIALPLLEMAFPKHRKWFPSSMGIGLAFIVPCFNSISMFLGALMAYLWEKTRPIPAEKYTVALSSGIIAGESLMGVVVMLLGNVLGYLE
ncbi:MAG: OPT family oligopeptide transporter [Polyangiales bacterium]